MAQTDTNTLIATFDSYSTAKQASTELEDIGISSGSIHIDSTQRTAAAGSEGYETSGDQQHTGFSGWWHSLFGSDSDDEERTGYEGAIAGGKAILRASVPASQVDAAADILNRYGATGVDSSSATTASKTGSGISSGSTARGENGTPIQVVEEELQVGKRSVQRGGVRVYSRLVSTPVEEQISLREERVSVERRPVNREISPEEVSAMRDQTIEVTETAEEVVVGKRARVREEVLVGKESTTRTETVRDNVRHTEIEVEELDGETPYSSSSTTGSGSRTTKATGMSPNAPTPGVLSGGGSTAGAGTLAGESTDGLGADLSSSYGRESEKPYGSDSNFEDSPSYQYGYRNASDSRYSGKSWDDVESHLRSDYESSNPGSTWEKVKNSVRSGWEKVTGKG